jgi:hypothetical protein
VQCAAIFALLSLFFVFPRIAGAIPPLKASHSWALFAFPPAWFLGVNEVLLGSQDPDFHALAHVAEAALGITILVSVAAYGIAYRRHVKKTLEAVEGGDGVRTRADQLITAAADFVARRPAERATLAFIGKTMARSAKHRILLAAYVGVGCAFVLQALVESGLSQAWLSVPLVLCFFILSGMRYIFTLPAELPANWIFRSTESDQRRQALNGSRRAMMYFCIAPLFIALSPFYFLLWSPAVALAHLAFSVVVSILLVEALLFDFWKLPFTCSYSPGSANITVLWAVYWFAFTTFAYSMASLESWMVGHSLRMVSFYASAAGIWAGFVWQKKKWDRVGFTLMFEDAPDPVVRTLGLSEAAWLAGRKMPPAAVAPTNARRR